ncbi:MAG: DUF1036 domain-containing protein [Proteobacteria bacterium]|nr:DUF1036 domain-containing protein [Pseudomonadota bacterium]
MKRHFYLLFLVGLSAIAAERKLVIDNPADRGVFIARSVETNDAIITDGYWNVMPQQKGEFQVPEEGKVAARLNFYRETRTVTPSGTKRCGSELEKFKSIEKKQGEPRITLFMGEGEIDGYATKKEGNDCAAVGGVLLDGFQETVACSSGAAGEMCLPTALTDNRPTPEAYVGACNETSIPELFVAIRFFENNEWRTQGWWKIKSQTCQKLGPFPSGKALYGFATTSSNDPDAFEWRSGWGPEMACINPESAFDYAEKADGKCEAREAIPADAPAPIKTMVGKLSEGGFRGLVNFNLKESFISVFRSASTGEIAISKDTKADSAKLAAKASCAQADCEELVQVQNQCFAFAIGDDAAYEYGWGRNASLVKAQELALNYCREGSQEPAMCRIIASECP